ncbi:MAG: hypothetical protein EXR05_01995 [Acetobacteraceae bacterium]|nr:hypothetical protein [Acetobacteraceae bacterium]MSP29692.1 hypothetical protein [Acetobacteraceae bacterium]
MSQPFGREWNRNLLLGVLFICLSGITSSLMNDFAKILTKSYNTVQISWECVFGHTLFMLAAFPPRTG